MSVILVLMPVVYLAPIAVASAAAAIKALEKRNQATGFVRVETRMKSAEMVQTALQTMGYQTTVEGSGIHATLTDSNVNMFRNEEGLWVAQFSSNVDEHEAIRVLSDLDREYGKLVQRALVEKLETRIPETRMMLLEKVTNPDQSVTLTLGVNA